MHHNVQQAMQQTFGGKSCRAAMQHGRSRNAAWQVNMRDRHCAAGAFESHQQPRSYGLYSYGLYSYGLYSSGLYSYDLRKPS